MAWRRSKDPDFCGLTGPTSTMALSFPVLWWQKQVPLDLESISWNSLEKRFISASSSGSKFCVLSSRYTEQAFRSCASGFGSWGHHLVVKTLESRRHGFHGFSFPDESHHRIELFGSEPQSLIAESLQVFQNMEIHRKHVWKNMELEGSQWTPLRFPLFAILNIDNCTWCVPACASSCSSP